MAYLSDIEIAQATPMRPIIEIADRAGVDGKYIEQYGRHKAKVDYALLNESTRPDGKLIPGSFRVPKKHKRHSGKRRKEQRKKLATAAALLLAVVLCLISIFSFPDWGFGSDEKDPIGDIPELT